MPLKLTPKEIKEIKTGLPDVIKKLNKQGEFYKGIAISVFDKWLTEEECVQICDPDTIVIADRRRKLENVVVEFYHLTKVYLWRYKRHDRISFYKPTSLQHLLKVCDIANQTGNDGHRYDILLPEYSVIYGEEFDWTNIIWYKDDNKISPLLKAVEKAGLFILPRD